MGVPSRLRFEILRRDSHACRYCGAKAPHAELEVDHVIPRHHGGSDDPSNLTAACKPCNRSKGAGIPNEQIIHDVRFDEACYQSSKGFPARPCMYCSKPVQQYPDDDPAFDDLTQCETCNSAVSDAFTAGVRSGSH